MRTKPRSDTEGAGSAIEPQRSVTVADLADHPELVEQVAEWRWREWAYGQPLAPFIEVTEREAGRGTLPITVVAIDEGHAVGAAGLDHTDEELNADERAGRTPWVVGVVVDQSRRGDGVGRSMLDELRVRAAERGHTRLWVATGDSAVDFYRCCGWELVDLLVLHSTGIRTTVLTSGLVSKLHESRGS